MKKVDSSAVKELVTFYSKNRQKFLNILRKNVNEPDTQDILHDAFIKAWENFRNFQGKANITTWFSVILRNLVYEHYSHKRRYQQLQTETIEDNSSLPSEQHLQNEVSSLLQQAIQSLPNTNYRQIIKLRYYNYLKFVQIHKTLGIKYKTAKVQHHRALKILKKLILKDPSFGGLLEYVKAKGFKNC